MPIKRKVEASLIYFIFILQAPLQILQGPLNIIDVYQQPHVAKGVDIIALPLLVRKLPLPERRLIGDLSDKEKVIRNLGILNLEQ